MLSLEKFLFSVCLHVRPLSVWTLNKGKQCQKNRTSLSVHRSTRGTVYIFITRYQRHCTRGSKRLGRTCPGMQELYMNKSVQWRIFICHAERNFTTKTFSYPSYTSRVYLIWIPCFCIAASRHFRCNYSYLQDTPKCVAHVRSQNIQQCLRYLSEHHTHTNRRSEKRMSFMG